MGDIYVFTAIVLLRRKIHKKNKIIGSEVEIESKVKAG